VNWRRLAGFRNILTHGYLDIDIERVVGIMDGFLVPLEQAVAAMLAEANEAEPPAP